MNEQDLPSVTEATADVSDTRTVWEAGWETYPCDTHYSPNCILHAQNADPDKSSPFILMPLTEFPALSIVQPFEGKSKEILRLDHDGKLTLDPQNVDMAAQLLVERVALVARSIGNDNIFKSAYVTSLEEENDRLKKHIATYEGSLKELATTVTAMGMVWEELGKKGGGEVSGIAVSKDIATSAAAVVENIADMIIQRLAALSVVTKT